MNWLGFVFWMNVIAMLWCWMFDILPVDWRTLIVLVFFLFFAVGNTEPPSSARVRRYGR